MRRVPLRWWQAPLAVLALGGLVFTGDAVFATGRPELTGDRFERIDTFVRYETERAGIPGAAVAVVAAGQTVHAAGYGSNGRGQAITPDTPFWIGSNTKSMTSLAVLRLVDDGRVDLDAPVQRYLPEFRLADPDSSAAITVRHVLNQTSGLARHDGLRLVVDAPRQPLADTVTDTARLRTNRPVGERFEYSNLNAVLLGCIVEVVTGRSWADVVTDDVFEPAGLNRTFADRDAADATGLTATHRTVFGQAVRTNAPHLDSLAPTGYVYASAADMARYLAVFGAGGTLDGRQVQPAAAVDFALTPATDERTFVLQGHEFTARYGAGWFVGPFGDAAPDARWHQGSLPHFSAWMVLLADTDEAVVVLLNSGNQSPLGGADAAWSRIPLGVVSLLRGQEPPTGPDTRRVAIVTATLAAAAVAAQLAGLARVAGRRWTPRGGMVRSLSPLAWEFGMSSVVLAFYPTFAGGLGWRGALLFAPDQTVTVAIVAVLAIATGVVRTVRLRRRLGAPPVAVNPAPRRAVARVA